MAQREPSTAIKPHEVPLGFLPAFEAAGRLGSFAAAAAELHVTPSAISQQIRVLEDVLGVPLFERNGRAALLTAAGRAYLEEVRDSLRALATSTSRLQRRAQASSLRLSTASLVAHDFLLPRLAAFRERFPEIELVIETSNDYVDFRTHECDAALRIGEGTSPELMVRPLGRAVATPVCSAELARSIERVEDLQHHTLLDPSGEGRRGYALLMAAAGLPPKAAKLWSFETCHEALRAAEHGVGFAFGVFPIAAHWVTSGRLTVPLAERLPLPGGLSFVSRRVDEAHFPFAEISEWLKDEYRALPALAVGRVVPHETQRRAVAT